VLDSTGEARAPRAAEDCGLVRKQVKEAIVHRVREEVSYRSYVSKQADPEVHAILTFNP